MSDPNGHAPLGRTEPSGGSSCPSLTAVGRFAETAGITGFIVGR